MLPTNHEEEVTPPSLLRRDYNHIYLWGDVTQESMLNLSLELDNAMRNIEWTSFSYKIKEIPPIILHINSDGGSTLPALALVDKLQTLNVTSVVEGLAASAASLLSISCTKRHITKNSVMLIHQGSGGVGGTFSQMKDNMELFEIVNKKAFDLYLDRTKITKKALRKYLEHDSWFDAEKSLELGLVDKII